MSKERKKDLQLEIQQLYDINKQKVIIQKEGYFEEIISNKKYLT